jgi:isochorismate synthase
MTLPPESFFFMSPYRSFTTAGCFSRFSHPAADGDNPDGEFQQKWRPRLKRRGLPGSQACDGRRHSVRYQ